MVKRTTFRVTFTVCVVVLCVMSGCLGERSSSMHAASYDIAHAYGKKNLVPVLIVGSGPAGMMAGVYGARLGKLTWILEGNKPGGLLTETTAVENWPGEVSIQGPEIMEKLKKQALSSGAHLLEDSVESIDTSVWPFRVTLESGLELHALSLVVTTGATPRKKGVPGEDTYWGTGVTSCAVCDAPFFKGEDVVVIGGGDSAVEEAMQLAPYARNVEVLVRRDRMRAAASMQDRLKGYGNVSVRYNADVLEVAGDGTKVTGVKLRNPQTGEESLFPTSGVFLAIGHDPNSQVLKGVVDLDAHGRVKVEGRSQRTSVPGIFAAGDVEDGDYRQAAVAAGSGVRAALDADRFLNEIGFDAKVADKLWNGMFFGIGAAAHGNVSLIESDEELQSVLKEAKGLVVVDFFGQSCPPCKQLMPVLDSVAGEMKDTVTFVKVDTGQAWDIAQKYLIQKLPMLLTFYNGEIVSRFAPMARDGSGVMSRTELRLFIQGILEERQRV